MPAFCSERPEPATDPQTISASQHCSEYYNKEYVNKQVGPVADDPVCLVGYVAVVGDGVLRYQVNIIQEILQDGKIMKCSCVTRILLFTYSKSQNN